MTRAQLQSLAHHVRRPLDEVHELWLERAAIREYEGVEKRDRADVLALDDVLKFFTTRRAA